MYLKRAKALVFSLTTTFALICAWTPLEAQKETPESEPQIMVTETGIEYEVAHWDSKTIYDPTSYSYVFWESPIFETVKTKSIYPVPMSEFDQPPVFGKDCINVENPLVCTNSKLMEFMKNESFNYPEKALNEQQEGLEYVSFVLNEKGEFEGRPSVLSKEKPCKNCADKALEIVKRTEGQWQPAVLDGEKVKVRLTIPVRFELLDGITH